MATATTSVEVTRIDKKGRVRPDLPFYQGLPVAISGTRWLIVVAACAVAFAQLVLLPIPGPALLQQWIHAILFPVIPLVTLAIVAPRGWTAVFRKVRLGDIGAMIGFAVLNLAITLGIGTVVSQFTDLTANPIGDTLNGLSDGDKVSMFLSTIPQLIGEEVVTILPLLAILSVLVRRLHWSRGAALTTAWIVTALTFGAMHLPTYGWNLVQCFVIIGIARLVLSLAYLKTKNLWVSSGAHIINDWVMFAAAIGGSSLALLA
ncbi:CPBP family intramembrane glutamic endopeptidase [Demequina maris]|uniref:CPBP family intramembrane glutamic endopeptidase n=1 Tax=Demequina maris TaxID=1638982 RepID=UPI000780E723|nr:type II CAAX endopeptidase family protein [Demequina maris]